MRNGRKPRMTLQTLATIAMNLFTICCACYIMTIIWSRIDPAGHVHQPAYRSCMRHHGDNPRPHPPHDNLHDHHPNERKGKTWERQSCNRR